MRLYRQAAKELKINVKPVKGAPVFLYTKGKKQIYFHMHWTSVLTAVGKLSCDKKNIAKALLKVNGLNTPKWGEFTKKSTNADIKKNAIQALKFPVVVKPNIGIHGKNIAIGVNKGQTIKKVRDLIKRHKKVLVEEMFDGPEVRLLATREKFLAATLRRPASVLGDGKNSIAELVKEKNSTMERKNDEWNYPALKKIRIGQVETEVLKQQKLSKESVPKKNKRIYLRKNSNISTGGDSIDVTDEIHTSMKKIAVQTIRAIPGLPFAGLDCMTKDYKKPQTGKSYTIIEINENPMISMHHYPYEGEPRNAAKDILKYLFNQN